MHDIRLAERARHDIQAILIRSRIDFGEARASRYLDLINDGLAALKQSPTPIGSYAEDSLQPQVRLFHLRHVRSLRSPRVAQPRHLLAYRLGNPRIEVLAVLHEAMDLKARIAALR